MNTVNLYWYNKKPNFGDVLSPIIVEYLSGLKCIHTTNECKKIIALGSILQCHPIFNNDIIWGAGFRNIYQDISYTSVDVKLVRGPKTRDMLLKNSIECPEKYCDPGVLAPFIYNINYNQKIKNELLVILHINDIESDVVNFLQKNNIKYITMSLQNNNILNILNEIACSKYVISSALHGIIVSECMNKQTGVLKLSKGDDFFKYQDYYLGSGRTLDDIKITDWRKEYDISKIIFIKKPKIDFDSLINTFPLKLKDNDILNKLKEYYNKIDIVK